MSIAGEDMMTVDVVVQSSCRSTSDSYVDCSKMDHGIVKVYIYSDDCITLEQRLTVIESSIGNILKDICTMNPSFLVSWAIVALAHETHDLGRLTYTKGNWNWSGLLMRLDELEVA